MKIDPSGTSSAGKRRCSVYCFVWNPRNSRTSWMYRQRFLTAIVGRRVIGALLCCSCQSPERLPRRAPEAVVTHQSLPHVGKGNRSWSVSSSAWSSRNSQASFADANRWRKGHWRCAVLLSTIARTARLRDPGSRGHASITAPRSPGISPGSEVVVSFAINKSHPSSGVSSTTNGATTDSGSSQSVAVQSVPSSAPRFRKA